MIVARRSEGSSMRNMKLKKGDEIIVTKGKDRGKRGKIEKIMPKDMAVLVPGLNIFKKHVKPQGQNKPGGIVDIIKPLKVTNIALICSQCGKQTRIGFVTNGTKKRICRKCKKEI